MEITKLIDQAQRDRDLQVFGHPTQIPATDRQKEYARNLGIDFDQGISRRALSILIDEAKKLVEETALEARHRAPSFASEQAIVDSLADRGFGAALLLFDLDDASEVIDADDLRRGDLNVRCYFGCAVPDMCRDAIREAVGLDVAFDADHADQIQY